MNKEENIYSQQNWSKKVRANNPKCLVCGREEDLTAHHVYGVSEYPFLAGLTSNGVTLCMGCHRHYHNLYEEVNPATFAEYIKEYQMRVTNITLTYNNGECQVITPAEAKPRETPTPEDKQELLNGGDILGTVISEMRNCSKKTVNHGWLVVTLQNKYGLSISEIEEAITETQRRGLTFENSSGEITMKRISKKGGT